MSLFNYRTVLDHLEVKKLLHDVQLTACIGDTEPPLQCIPQLLARGKLHVGIDQILTKNTDHSPSEQGVVSLIRSLLIESARPHWYTLSDVPHVHGHEP